MKKTYRIKNFKGNLIESLSKFQKQFPDQKLIETIIDESGEILITTDLKENVDIEDCPHCHKHTFRVDSHTCQGKCTSCGHWEKDAKTYFESKEQTTDLDDWITNYYHTDYNAFNNRDAVDIADQYMTDSCNSCNPIMSFPEVVERIEWYKNNQGKLKESITESIEEYTCRVCKANLSDIKPYEPSKDMGGSDGDFGVICPSCGAWNSWNENDKFAVVKKSADALNENKGDDAVVEALMKRDKISKEEATKTLADAKKTIEEIWKSGGGFDECIEEWQAITGLEPDYLFSISLKVTEAMTQQIDGMQKVFKKHSYAADKDPVWFILIGKYGFDRDNTALAFDKNGKHLHIVDAKNASTTKDPNVILTVAKQLEANPTLKTYHCAIMYERYVYGVLTQLNHARDYGKAFYNPNTGWTGLDAVKDQEAPLHQTDTFAKMQKQEKSKQKAQPSKYKQMDKRKLPYEEARLKREIERMEKQVEDMRRANSPKLQGSLNQLDRLNAELAEVQELMK